MNKEVNNIIVLNKELTDKIDASLSDISKSLAKTKFKYTGKALLSFIPKSGYLNSALLNSYLDQNVYAMAVLFRSVIEHSFRHLYLFTRALNEDSDSVGDKYYNLLNANEDLEAIKKINDFGKIVYPDKTIWSFKGDHNKQISDTAQEFGIKQIFCYLITNNKSTTSSLEKYQKDYLLQKLRDYTNLSSAVHGGPFAEKILLELHKDKDKLGRQLDTFSNDGFYFFKILVETTYLFAYLMDNDVKEHYESIKNIPFADTADHSI